MDEKRIDELLREAQAVEAEEAEEAGAIAFSARATILATLPYRDPGEVSVFGRHNGGYSMTIQPGVYVHPGGRREHLGFPYGNIPRLLLVWLTTEAFRTRSQTLELGKSLSAFMTELGLKPTGGREGSIPRLREQMRRLFAASISCIYKDERDFSIQSARVAEKAKLWWDDPRRGHLSVVRRPEEETLLWEPQRARDAGSWRSTVTLGASFYQEIIERPVPVDLRVIQKLKKSPMALDIYAWLTYRLSYLKRPTLISWRLLKKQFGTDYARLRAFRENFLAQLAAVQMFYARASVISSVRGLLLSPSEPHIPPRPKG